jgi:serine/threonine-protein kinase HipA
MSINGKRDEFTRADLHALARMAGIKKTRANQMLDRVTAAVRRWPEFARKVGVPTRRANEIQRNQRVAM